MSKLRTEKVISTELRNDKILEFFGFSQNWQILPRIAPRILLDGLGLSRVCKRHFTLVYWKWSSRMDKTDWKYRSYSAPSAVFWSSVVFRLQSNMNLMPPIFIKDLSQAQKWILIRLMPKTNLCSENPCLVYMASNRDDPTLEMYMCGDYLPTQHLRLL